MELTKKVTFNVKMDATGDAITVNDCTLVFESEDDVLNRAVDSAVILIQGGLRRNAKKEGNGALTFKAECAALCNGTFNVPTPGVRIAGAPKDVSNVVKNATQSMRDKFPGITSDELLEFHMTPTAEQPGLMAKFAQKYIGKSAK